ncbi:MAG: response regulator [Acidobacteria bacterium]|nr:response regulator [Acidobacteriota bacterium]
MEVGYCYRREGSFNQSRSMPGERLGQITGKTGDKKALSLLRSAAAERAGERFNDALRLLIEAAPLFEATGNHALKGSFHHEYAQVLSDLGTDESRADYIERALNEAALAVYHFEQAGSAREQAVAEKALGFLYGVQQDFASAHERLDRAQALFTSLKDRSEIALVDETRARVLLKEGRAREAEKFARAAVLALEADDERQSALASALTTHGVALARLGRHEEGRRELESASLTAERAEDVRAAGEAALTIIEELGEQLTIDELSVIYERAFDLLSASRKLATKDRLLSSARRALFLASVLPTAQTWENFSLKDALRRYEARIIERALRDADKSVTRAARMLDFRNHTSLIKKLKRWHEDLLAERAPARERKRSLMFIGEAEEAESPRPVSLLHVEDDRLIASAVKETLEREGWKVLSLTNGEAALAALGSDAPYDLLIFDYELPDINGVELIRRTRRIEHRQHTPVIMLSGSAVEREARREGVSAFLRKPEEIVLLTETIARLLARKPKLK